MRWHHKRFILRHILQDTNALEGLLSSISETLRTIASQQQYNYFLHNILADKPRPPPALYSLGLYPDAISGILSIDFFDLNTVIHWQNHLSNADLYRYFRRRLFELRARETGLRNSTKERQMQESYGRRTCKDGWNRTVQLRRTYVV
jgi:hypothetical protein